MTPRDLAEIKVYHNENLLCKAICQDIAEMVVNLKVIKTARRGIKKDLYLEIKKSQAVLNSIVKARKIEKTTAESEVQDLNKSSPKKPPLKLYDND